MNLPVFEGPLDLLLHLVTKNRIDIHDIPIHEITEQYLAYLRRAQAFDLELASSFFAMASTLIFIKSRRLLPKRRQEAADETEDPRAELARSLEEFKRMKEIKGRIEELIDAERPYWKKEPEAVKGGLYQGRISLLKLRAAFLSLYDSLHEEKEEILAPEEVSMEQEMKTLKETLSCLHRVNFTQYFRRLKTRLRLAVTLVALLELIRLGEAGVIEGAGGLEIVSGESAKRIRNEE